MSQADFLFELGVEELPTKAVSTWGPALAEAITAELAGRKLTHGAIHHYCTPRRVAVLVEGLTTRQPDTRVERRGPALAAAYDDAGQPTKAALGFAASCGVDIAEVGRLETDKGAWLNVIKTEPGSATAALLPAIVEAAVGQLPIAKRMRWADLAYEFARPVQWLVALFGSELVPLTLFGVDAGRETRGHRFHCPNPLPLGEAGAYADTLKAEGHVIASFAERRSLIATQVHEIGVRERFNPVMEPELLDEVTSLVEWPVAVLGGFDPAFLEVPQEALVEVMSDHQKYFHVLDDDGLLLPKFITIANLDSKDPSAIVAGNERVIRPRFADARFFFDNDRSQRLDSRLDALGAVVYEKNLGTLHDKTLRVQALASSLAETVGADSAIAARAALLSRCDLTTQMVFEFPEMQGIAGRYYAQHDGEQPGVAAAIEGFYHPRFAGDTLPGSREAMVVAIADRLDTLVGIFGIGKQPTGAKDPFGLRRAALGLIRIAIEGRVDFPLEPFLAQAMAGVATRLPQRPDGDAGKKSRIPEDPAGAVARFIGDRLRQWCVDAGYSPQQVEAVAVAAPGSLVDFDARLKAVQAFGKREEAEALAAANKRIANILKKVEPTDLAGAVAPERYGATEAALANAIAEADAVVAPLLAERRYNDALARLAALRGPVDAFFDDVMVMDEDPVLRRNRLGLLAEVQQGFMAIADIGKLSG